MKKKVWRQCGKKHRYRDEHEVKRYKKKCENERKVSLDYYYCVYCNGYHLTSVSFNEDGLVNPYMNKYRKES